MVKFSCSVFRARVDDYYENEKDDWSKCPGFPVTGYRPEKGLKFPWIRGSLTHSYVEKNYF